VEQAGADGIELNCSCPHGIHLMRGQDIVDAMTGALAVARESTKLPLVPKITPQLARPDQAAVALQDAGASAVVMFNRFTGLDIDIETGRPILHGGYAGHGGPWAIHYVLRWLTTTFPQLSIPIAASGGAFDAQGVIKMILAGATVVQICSAVVVEGYSVIGRLVSRLAEYLDSHAHRSVHEIRGLACNYLTPIEDVDRHNRYYATIDPDACTGCGLCMRVCVYGAVAEAGSVCQIDPAACDGCGLCAELCPSNAIRMAERARPLERT
jgi:dihydroorotate dehydrogenase (fumarate)